MSTDGIKNARTWRRNPLWKSLRTKIKRHKQNIGEAVLKKKEKAFAHLFSALTESTLWQFREDCIIEQGNTIEKGFVGESNDVHSPA